MKFIPILLVLLSVNAFAHLKFGRYLGTNVTKEACSVVVLEKRYFMNKKHPLNEKVMITHQQTGPMELEHAVLDHGDTLGVDKDQLIGKKGNGPLLLSFTLVMSHEEGKEGPEKFTVKSFDLSKQEFKQEWCYDLVFQGTEKE